jgi:hypothetical protein
MQVVLLSWQVQYTQHSRCYNPWEVMTYRIHRVHTQEALLVRGERVRASTRGLEQQMIAKREGGHAGVALERGGLGMCCMMNQICRCI